MNRKGLDMLVYEIEKMKEKLDSMIDSGSCSYNEILEFSQRLDILIVRYYQEA